MHYYLYIFLQNFYFFLPAYLANSIPVLAAKLKIFDKMNIPIDCGKFFLGKRVLGDNKTFRGFITGITASLSIGIIQHIIYTAKFTDPNFYFVNYYANLVLTLLYSLLMGSGALIGDSIKSFIKRRIDIPSGATFFVADQIDYIFGTLFFILPFIHIPTNQILIFIITGFIVHILSGIVSKLTGLKKTWI